MIAIKGKISNLEKDALTCLHSQKLYFPQVVQIPYKLDTHCHWEINLVAFPKPYLFVLILHITALI